MSISIELNKNYSEKVRYNHPDYPFHIKRNLLSQFPNYTAPNHWHDDIELIAVLSGEMKYNVNGQIISLKSNEGILVNAGQMHFGFSDIKSECDFVCLLLHPILLCPIPSYERDFIRPLIQDSNLSYLLLRPEISWQREIYDQILFLLNMEASKTAPLRILSSFSTLWALLYENLSISQNSPSPQNRDLSIIKNMVSYIQKNYEKKLSLADIATSGAVGQSKCCKLFARYFSSTPTNYLNQYRLNKSIELLRDTNLSILEIALSVGFRSASYYAETFRKWFQQSPTEFRKTSTILNTDNKK